MVRRLCVREQKQELRLEGIVHSFRGRSGMFPGVRIEGSDGTEWLVDHSSLFHAFADRQVVVTGSAFNPDRRSGSYIIETPKLRHLRVSTMRLVEQSPASDLVAVGNGSCLTGRFARGACETGEVVLSFVIEKGESFIVANGDPTGATVGPLVDVWAYCNGFTPPSLDIAPYRFLWIICPCSEPVTWDFRRRSGMGPFARSLSPSR
jgi:hypothetical protein